MNVNHIKLEVHDTYEKDEKLKTKFEADDNEDVIKKSYLDENLSKTDGQVSYVDKDYNECKLQYSKQSLEEVLIHRADKTTIQILYDKWLFANFQNPGEILEDFFIATRRGSK